MSLSDFLGRTNEIIVIDFLSGNRKFKYSIDELTDYLNENSDVWLSTFDMEYLLTKLIYNGIVIENDGYFELAENSIVTNLISSIFANSNYIAKTMEPDENKILKDIHKELFE